MPEGRATARFQAVLSLAVVGRTLPALWCWFRPRPGSPRSWLRLVGAVLILGVCGLLLLVTISGLQAMGPVVLAQRRMLGRPAPELAWSTEHGQADPLPRPDTGRPTTFLVERDGVVRQVAFCIPSYGTFEAMVTPNLESGG